MSRLAIEEADRYVIPLSGRCVSRCYVDFAFGLLFYEDGPKTEVRIEGRMKLLANRKQYAGDATDLSTVTPFLAVFCQKVAEAYALKDGTLQVEFENDMRLEVEPLEQFEAWELTAADGLKIVSLPGGGTAFWQARE